MRVEIHCGVLWRTGSIIMTHHLVDQLGHVTNVFYLTELIAVVGVFFF